MKVIIPYREDSSRCYKKNTREFYYGKSLLEVSVENLCDHEVSLACIPSPLATSRAEKLGVGRIDLTERTATGSWSDLGIEIAGHIEEEHEPIGFVLCCNPVFYRFNSVNDFLLRGEKAVKTGKNAVTVYPLKHYILDADAQPVNYKSGSLHGYSQNLPLWNINAWVVVVTTAYDMERFGYFHSNDLTMMKAAGPCIDIDTVEDFHLARIIYTSCPQMV